MFSRLRDWGTRLFLGKYLGSVVRTVLAALGGFLVARGLATPETAKEVTEGLQQLLMSPEFLNVVGAVLFGTAQGASILEKYKRE